MKDNMLRKGMVFAIIVLFVGTSIIPGISGNIRESISVKDVDHFDNSWGRCAPEQINEADEDKKYELKHRVVFSKDDLVFDTLMGYDTVVLKDGSCINEIGKPMLPAKQIRIAVPAGMEVLNVHVVDIEREELPDMYNIFPAQAPVRTDDSDREISFVKPDAEIYTSSKPYPPEDVKLGDQTDLAGQAMIPVTIYPLRYMPKQKRLTLITSIELVIDGVDGYVCGDYLPRKISVSGREMYNHMVTEMVENPEDVELQSLDTPSQPQGVPLGDYDYVIITQDSWVDDFQPLADWKTKKGIPANIVTTDWIYSEYSGSNADKIRAFVQDAHGNWGAIYFLLGGDSNVIPYYTRNINDDDIPGDTYYADYDYDWTCEVHVGRAPVRVTGEWGIDTFIDKIFTYEKDPPLSNYAKTAFFMGFDLKEYGSNEGEGCKEYIKNNYLPGSWTYRSEYDSESGTHKTDVLNYLNQGNHLVNHIDHSGTDVMGTGYTNHWSLMFTSEAKTRSNGDRQSIIYSIGCWPCDFPDSECIAEGFVRNPNGGGIAFVGNTRSGWYSPYYDDYYSLRYDRYFFRSLFSQGHYNLGECFSDHKNDAYQVGSTYKYIFYELTLLGDPELPIWTENPQSLDVTHPSTLPDVSSSFLVHVEELVGGDVGNAYVCLWKDDEVYERGYTNSNGDVTFNPSSLTEGTMYVTVTKHNYIPYEGDAEVIPYTHPPYAPSNPTPSNGSTGVSINANLSWTNGYPLTYALQKLGTSDLEGILIANVTGVEIPADVFGGSVTIVEQGDDITPPVTTCELDPPEPNGDNGWYTVPVMVTLNATDEGSGVASTWYRLDGGYWKLYTNNPFVVSGDGEHTVEYFSIDCAGNIEPVKNAVIKIDTTPPVTTCELDGIMEGGVYITGVTVTLTATDDTSGVNYTMYKINDGEWMNYTEPFSVTENGDYTIEYYSVDLNGNIESMVEVYFKIVHENITYDVYFGTVSPPPKVVSNQSEMTYDPGRMEYETMYYWQIVAWNEHGLSTPGPIWDFTVQEEILTVVSIQPDAQTVEKGETFTASYYIEPTDWIIGANFVTISFDPTLLQANFVTEGDFFDSVGGAMMFSGGSIDNVAGTISDGFAFVQPWNAVNTSGSLYVVNFTAKQKLGTSNLTMSGVSVKNNTGTTIPVTVEDGSVTVEEFFYLTISVDGDGTTVPAPGVHTYTSGTVVDLEAIPDRGWSFDHWDGDVADPYSATTNITMDANKTVTAYFTEDHYILNVSTIGNGHVDVVPDKAFYLYGEEPELTAVADLGWSFAGWSGDLTGDINPTTVFMDGNKAVTATFTDIGPPEIMGVTLLVSDPLDTDVPFGWENFSCIVTDNVAVNQVKLVVTYLGTPPLGTTEYLMTNIPGTDVYYYNTTLTDAGNYDYYIWADDTSGNEDRSETERFYLPMNEDVDMNGQVYFEDLIAIVWHYGETGPPGWIREDVNNDGRVDFDDLIAVVMHYGEEW